MKIAIIGGTGLLGSNLLKLYAQYDVKSFSRKQSSNVDSVKNYIIDFKYLEDELNRYFIVWKPDIIINTVAIVNLQQCEDNYDIANSVNCNIAIELSKLSKKYNSYFIHISTDHYFNDNKKVHNEVEGVTLLNNYAKTKYNAERSLVKYTHNYLIVRTNIIGFRRRSIKSFFEWLLDSLKKEEEIHLYTNFYTSPISVNELGLILLKCYEKKLIGTYNISSRGVISKYDFGIMTANMFGYSTNKIKESVLAYKDFKVARALTLGLDVAKIENDLKMKMPTIEKTLENLYREYKENYEQ